MGDVYPVVKVAAFNEEMARRGDARIQLEERCLAGFGDHEVEAAEPAEPESTNQPSRGLGHRGVVDHPHDRRRSTRLRGLDDLQADELVNLTVEARHGRDGLPA